MAPYFLGNLIPKKEKVERTRPLWEVLKGLTWSQWGLFLSGYVVAFGRCAKAKRGLNFDLNFDLFNRWLAWSCDAIDFFSVSLTIENLRQQFGRSARDIVSRTPPDFLLHSPNIYEPDDFHHPHPVVPFHRCCNYLPISLLSYGYVSYLSLLQVIFGLVSDRFGRKWPLIGNLLLISCLSLGCSFVQTFQQFLAVRSLFGVGMGGIWGLASSSALENLPVEARGLVSGIMQQGYASGYLIAAIVNLYLIPHTSWREQFRTSAGISAFTAFLRFLLPESEVFIRARQELKQVEVEKSGRSKTRIFFHEIGQMLKKHWLLSIYAVLLMSGFNFLSHGSQDLYPTYLQESKDFTKTDATIATIIGSCGAIAYVYYVLLDVWSVS